MFDHMFAVFFIGLRQRQGCVARSGESEQHTLSGSTGALRSRNGSFSFLSCSLTLILIVMGVSSETALLLCLASMTAVCVCAKRRECLELEDRLMVSYDEARRGGLSALKAAAITGCQSGRRCWSEYLLHSTCVVKSSW